MNEARDRSANRRTIIEHALPRGFFYFLIPCCHSLRGHAHSQFPAVTVWGHQLLDHLFAAAGPIRQIEVSLLTSPQAEVISGFRPSVHKHQNRKVGSYVVGCLAARFARPRARLVSDVSAQPFIKALHHNCRPIIMLLPSLIIFF